MKCQFCGKKINWIEGLFGASACDKCAREGQIRKHKKGGIKK